MYLHDLTIINYRKFGSKNNTVQFVGNNNDIDIAESSTLIIGKNNSGKTTIANAFTFLLNSKQPQSTDFNLLYLKELIEKYTDNESELENQATPEMSFILKIKYDDVTEDGDLLTNLGAFVDIGEEDDLATIVVRYSIKEEQGFWEKIHNSVLTNENPLEAFQKLLDESKEKLFQIDILDKNDNVIENFNLNKIIKLEVINAETRQKSSLSEVFSRIVSYQFTENEVSYNNLKESIGKIEDKITTTVATKQQNVADVLKSIEPNTNHVDFSLTGNIDEKTIFNSLVKYHFSDGEDNIPESQFGLGYVHLLKIIGSLTHYIDSFERDNHKSQINLLFIEEPEAFMHPQMQEFFISRMNKAVKKAIELALGEDNDSSRLQCQVIITTHSSHIVNSKITTSNSFNHINYISSNKKNANVIRLNDENIRTDESSGGLSFIIKHIKYKVSELFFSDAIVFVEGVTEEALLKYYLDRHEYLKNHYISVFNIGGAHAKEYYSLIKALTVPCLIITDLDIKRADNEKSEGDNSEYLQLTHLNGRETTNSTLEKFHENSINFDSDNHNSKNLADIINQDYFEDDNIRLTYQKDTIENYFATSLEEAFILTNFDNNILNNTLQYCRPQIYKDIVGEEMNTENVKSYSFKLQKKLGDGSGKTQFTSELLYQMLSHSPSDDSQLPTLPQYIIDGFSWLQTKLEGAE